MNRIWMILILSLLLMKFSGFCEDSEIQIAATVDKQKIHVGDRVRFEITVTAPSDIRLIMPSEEMDIKPFRILDSQRSVKKLDGGKTEEKLILTISGYEIGEQEIPTVEINYQTADGQSGTRRTEPMYLRIDSLLTNENSKPKDLKNPLVIDAATAYKVGVVGLAMLIIGVIVFMFWHLHRRKTQLKLMPPLSPPPRPADEIAFEALQELSRKTYVSQGEFKKFFVELIEIFKAYLANRFAIPVLERTTGEMRRDIRSSTINQKFQPEIIDALELADLVKFAKYKPAEQVCYDAFNRVETIIHNTRESSRVEKLLESNSESADLVKK